MKSTMKIKSRTSCTHLRNAGLIMKKRQRGEWSPTLPSAPALNPLLNLTLHHTPSLVSWAAACGVLMFSVTAVFWRFLPKLEFMQFPWRWLLCLSMIFSLLVTVGLRRWWWRAVIVAVSILVIVGTWRYAQAPWWDTAADLREMQDNMATGAGYEGTDEYTPLGAEPGAIDKEARAVTVDGPAHGAIHVQQWGAESKMFTAEMATADRVALRLFRYPAWRVEVNGRVMETTARAETGQMLVPVEAGMNRVEIRFVRTWDRAAGGWISFITAIAVIVWLRMSRVRNSDRPV